ncbi:MAG: histidine kinase dimerization/phospho-acceptor domain-containing protein, partial [Eubacteriales bacterium]
RLFLIFIGLTLLGALIFIGTAPTLLQIVLILLIAGGISILVAVRTAKWVAKPVADAAEFLAKMEAQNQELKQSAVKSDSELLARGVTSLASLLDRTIDELQDTNSSQAAMLRAIPCAVVAVGRDKKIMMANSMAKSFFEMDEDCEGRYFIECVRQVSMERMIDAAIAAEKNVEEERRVLSVTGENFYKINVAPIKKMERVTGAVLMAQDITDIKHLELMRRDFAANVSHELKTPLTVINGFLETIKTEKDLDEKTRARFMDIISLETERLSRLIEDILSLSEIETGNLSHLEQVNVDECLRRSLELLRGRAKDKHIQLETCLEFGENTVLGSADRVSQMAINLIDNAIKYTPEGGRVFVSTKRIESNCMITVEDNGIGIGMDDQRRSFERFYRADK